MVYVMFDNPLSFIAELERAKETGKEVHHTVRLALLSLPTPVPEIRNEAAVATARVGDDILRMEVSCGVSWQTLNDAIETSKQFFSYQEDIEEGCRELGLELGKGVFEFGEPQTGGC